MAEKRSAYLALRQIEDSLGNYLGAITIINAGLGLAICKEIMANLGGEITYLPGQGGAAFRIVLPRRPPVPADAGLRRA